VIDTATIAQLIGTVATPDGATIASGNRLAGVHVSGATVMVALSIEPAEAGQFQPVQVEVERRLKAVPGVEKVFVSLTAERAKGEAAPTTGNATTAPSGPPPVPGIKRIIAVASGKGGVGKSTTAANLALAMLSQGLRVGLLDADIYGPSVPRLMGVSTKPDLVDGKRLRPVKAHGLEVMSIGFMVEPEAPMIWRGPMIDSALTQMLREVAWDNLDLLIVDMPPGTGDAQLTLAQKTPLAGAIIVSTPQDLALIDARKGIAMFQKVDVPVLGVIENMSTFLCPTCGARCDIFGHGGAEREAARIGVPFLGGIPLHMAIRETADAGRPSVVADPTGPHAEAYRAVAARILALLDGPRAPTKAPTRVAFGGG
jgi:ATP-binding protein involved in chromosome partitioning